MVIEPAKTCFSTGTVMLLGKNGFPTGGSIFLLRFVAASHAAWQIQSRAETGAVGS
jgi:hypothetical protein